MLYPFAVAIKDDGGESHHFLLHRQAAIPLNIQTAKCHFVGVFFGKLMYIWHELFAAGTVFTPKIDQHQSVSSLISEVVFIQFFRYVDYLCRSYISAEI